MHPMAIYVITVCCFTFPEKCHKSWPMCGRSSEGLLSRQHLMTVIWWDLHFSSERFVTFTSNAERLVKKHAVITDVKWLMFDAAPWLRIYNSLSCELDTMLQSSVYLFYQFKLFILPFHLHIWLCALLKKVLYSLIQIV